MAATVQVIVHTDAIDHLLASGAMRDALYNAATPVVADARRRAPKDTGRGAASIHSEMVLTDDEWEALISWDQLRYYMKFSESGTQTRPARPFLVPALRAAQR